MSGLKFTSGDCGESISSERRHTSEVKLSSPPSWNSKSTASTKQESIIVIVLYLSSEMGIFSNSSTFDGLVGKLLLPCILYKVEISELKILSQKQSNMISFARVFHNARPIKHIPQELNLSLKKVILFNIKEKISLNCCHHHHFI